MDVKALYPSMSWNAIVAAVIRMINNSEMAVENVDWHEVGKYLAVMMTNGRGIGPCDTKEERWGETFEENNNELFTPEEEPRKVVES
jgi:hypothetical protein